MQTTLFTARKFDRNGKAIDIAQSWQSPKRAASMVDMYVKAGYSVSLLCTLTRTEELFNFK